MKVFNKICFLLLLFLLLAPFQSHAGGHLISNPVPDSGGTEQFLDTPGGTEQFHPDTSSGSGGSLKNPIEQDTIYEFFSEFLDIIVQITFPFVVLAVVYTGFLFLKAQGKPEELEKAKRALLWTIVGALIVLGASAIADLIGSTVDDIRG